VTLGAPRDRPEAGRIEFGGVCERRATTGLTTAERI
jgi:hypothetical protein